MAGRGRGATQEDCLVASGRIEGVLTKLGLQRHASKGVWSLHHRPEVWGHGVVAFGLYCLDPDNEVYSDAVKTTAHEENGWGIAASSEPGTKSGDLRSFEQLLLLRSVPDVGGSLGSLLLARPVQMPPAEEPEAPRKWAHAGALEQGRAAPSEVLVQLGPEGRCTQRADTILYIQFNTADIGWGGMIGTDAAPESAGSERQGLRNGEERSKTIVWRELKALRLLLQSLQAAHAVLASKRSRAD